MSLIKTLVTSLGPTIAKSILKILFRDSDIAIDASSTIVDLLAGKTEDLWERQQWKRIFEEIGENAAKGFVPLFEKEQLKESSKVAITLAVVETLEEAQISSELLAEKDLDVLKLKEHLNIVNLDATRDFSELETELYRHTVLKAAIIVLDIAQQFPDFNKSAFAELLKRHREILRNTNYIIDEYKRIRDSTQFFDQDKLSAQFEEYYLSAVIRNLDEIELLGADISTISRRYRLSVAYITLSAAKANSDVDDGKARENTQATYSVDQLLATSHNLMIRGLAGSGKTTLLKWIAVQSASRNHEEPLKEWNKFIPFFIQLRQCVDKGLPAPEEFPRLVSPAIAGMMPNKKWVHERLKDGRAIVLVDGLDEMPEIKRTDIYYWLQELAEAYEKSRFILTSRPHAISKGRLINKGFQDAELRPMTLTSIDLFIEHWHKAVGHEIQKEEEIRKLSDYARRLKTTIRRNNTIRNLAANPLLCAMICALNRDRREQLPIDKIELYKACCILLLERREREKRIDLSDYPKLRYRQKHTILEDLAYWMLQNGYAVVSRKRASKRIERKLKQMIGLMEIQPEKILQFFLERTNMIQEPVREQISFAHLTFQEYLAATAILNEDDVGFLVNNSINDQWHEVIILTAGLASKKTRRDLILSLISRGDEENTRRHQMHLLAVSCLGTSTELDPKVQSEVQTRIDKLVPPKDFAEAKAIASAGDLAAPFLKKSEDDAAEVSAASVYALSLIQSSAALSTLSSYKNETRQEVIDELLYAWDSFDYSEYAQLVLTQIEKLHLSDKDIYLLERIKYLSSLKELIVEAWGGDADLDSISYLSNLISLELKGFVVVRDLEPLASLTNLTSLLLDGVVMTRERYEISTRYASGLKPLSKLTNLETLHLSEMKSIYDLTPLTSLARLTSLHISDMQLLNDLSPLASLSNLSSLYISNIGSNIDLSPLLELKNLQNLQLHGFEPASIPEELYDFVDISQF